MLSRFKRKRSPKTKPRTRSRRNFTRIVFWACCWKKGTIGASARNIGIVTVRKISARLRLRQCWKSQVTFPATNKYLSGPLASTIRIWVVLSLISIRFWRNHRRLKACHRKSKNFMKGNRTLRGGRNSARIALNLKVQHLASI